MSAGALDPFAERGRRRLQRRRLWLLGAPFEFTSASAALLALVDDAFGGLPAHRLRNAPRLRVHLELTPAGAALRAPPPAPRLSAGGGLLCAHIDGGNFALVAPRLGSALVVATRALLRQPHYLRYELLEFAVLTLAARAQRLVALHAACVSHRGRGVLVIGDSGAGKTTLCLHAMLAGLEFVSEDSLFVEPGTLRATGIPAFVHLRADTAARVTDARLPRAARFIRRRSGERKRVLDVRRSRLRMARDVVRLVAVVVLDARRAAAGTALRTLGSAALSPLLRRTQPYARGLPRWSEFTRRIAALPAYRLLRTGEPADAAHALQELLGSAP